MDEIFDKVYSDGKLLFTKNKLPGKKVYDERCIKRKGVEYRGWDPFRSKLAGAIRKGLKNFPFVDGCKVLYLGASTGTTVSHLSDIVGDNGEIYSVEFAPHCMQLFIKNTEGRENVIPILADANKPQDYKDVGTVDVIYEDVAQPNQAEIMNKNADAFLKKDGIAMITIKSQSIDVTRKPDETFEIVLKELSTHFEILEKMKLEPFDKDHLFVVLRKK